MRDRNNSLDPFIGAIHRGEIAVVDTGLGFQFFVPVKREPMVLCTRPRQVEPEPKIERAPEPVKPRFVPTIVPKEPA